MRAETKPVVLRQGIMSILRSRRVRGKQNSSTKHEAFDTVTEYNELKTLDKQAIVKNYN